MSRLIQRLILAMLICGGTGMAETTSHRLPEPQMRGGAALADVLNRRRSIRDYSALALSLKEVGQLLWAAQGITSPEGFRAAPSAGALYPLTLYLVAGAVTGLPPGNYRYDPQQHALQAVVAGDLRLDLSRAALGQTWIQQSPAVVVISADYSRTTWKYGKRGIRYVQMEVGHAAQNLFLQAVAMDLASVVVGAFDDDALKALLGLPEAEQPLSLLPVGHPRRNR